ncbi:Peptidase S9/S15 [Macrophomina phaseolina MS6]|uniref:Peptidase S9/S15 n=1 Tax=Macrophomina phaseolina (strain MS6) TaxID=1126212 RepID=K2RYB5_MACPH|nr:Peptidase S9/S15 [Macrophomina phaseolina MS6]
MPVPIQVAYKPIGFPEIGKNNYQGFHPGKTEVLPAGWRREPDTRPLTSPIRVDHDVEIVVRDGCRLYIDVYRPADAQEKVPAILAWSCYGKKYSALDMLPMTVWHCCVKRSELSGLEKFEGLDPARWCPKGYALVSVDGRGTGHSDGQIPVMGSQDAEDGYDVVEAVARLDWCNGAVGMAGNSALAISQWFVAALRPPSLKAIAPWEGMGDLFREQFCRGGIFSMSNFDLITKEIIKGGSGVEDFAEMYRRCPTANVYWKDKRVDMTKVETPAFILGSDVSGIHTMGSIRAWLEIPHEKKWLKWGSKQEWFELYSVHESNEELTAFFDRYLKGLENGWEKTPKVRWSVLKFGDHKAEENIVLEDYPAPNTEYRELYLQAGEKLGLEKPEESVTKEYDSEKSGSVAEFDYTFMERARLLGLPKAVLYMSCPDKDDMCVYVMVRKKDKDGKTLMHLNFPVEATPVNSIEEIPEKQRASLNLHQGSVGQLRASHRAIDESKSIHPQFPFHPHAVEERIPPGEIVKLEIGIWNASIDFEAGETINIAVGGQYPSIAEYKSYSAPRPEHEKNKGVHRIHLGPEHPSRVILPFVSV